MRNKLFGTANEKYLRAVTVYFNSTDSILYYNYNSTAETQFTNAVSKNELVNMFNKGILVVDTGSALVRPTVLTIDTKYAAVSHTTVTTAETVVTPVVTTYYSDGYTAE